MSVFFPFQPVIASAVIPTWRFGRDVGASLPQFIHGTLWKAETNGNKAAEPRFRAAQPLAESVAG